uniref:Uncharacterized protein n=1 Tax=Arundo donax TaxID=35708 RepID=A0A0A9A4F5_ARUDO
MFFLRYRNQNFGPYICRCTRCRTYFNVSTNK